jgi:hypothetical protein
MLRVEVIIGLIASSVAILGFMARAYSNIRKGKRIKRYGDTAATLAEQELARMREEFAAAEEMRARRREREKGA